MSRRPARPQPPRHPTGPLRPRRPTRPLAGHSQDDDEPVEGRVMIASKRDKRRAVFVVYMLLLVGAILAGGIYFVAGGLSSGGGQEIVQKGDRLATSVNADTLRAAVDAGVRGILAHDGMINEGWKKTPVRVAEAPSIHDTVQAIRDMKRRDGSSLGFDPGNGHAADAGSPTVTRYLVLRAELAVNPKNPVEDLQFVIIRAYTSESAMREALKSLSSAGRGTKARSVGRYTIAQYSKVTEGPAHSVIDSILNSYQRAFNAIIPPPDSPSE